MRFEDYQKQALEAAFYLGEDTSGKLAYSVLAFCGEAGEVANEVKKILRDKGGEVDEKAREILKEELGDALWYMAAIAHSLGISLEEVAQINLNKAAARRAAREQ